MRVDSPSAVSKGYLNMPGNPQSKHVAVSELFGFCERGLISAGVSPDDAAVAADTLVTTDSFGVSTHGTKLLAAYLRRLLGGGVRADGRPCIARELPGCAVVDGQSALGQVSGVFAMKIAIDKAKRCGLDYAGVYNGSHFGALGYYSLLAANAGLIGCAMCNDVPSVAAPGSRVAVTGTNPLSYAIPAGRREPIFFDAAMSTVAGGKVYAARMLGKPIPGDWLIGRDGRPTTDASLYPDAAFLAPMSGHKGYALAILIETLSSLLNGGAVTWQIGSWIYIAPSQPSCHSAAFLAIDVAAMQPLDEFVERVDALVDEIHGAQAAEGCPSVLLPGEREWRNRQAALTQGILLPPDVIGQLAEAASLSRVHPAWLT